MVSNTMRGPNTSDRRRLAAAFHSQFASHDDPMPSTAERATNSVNPGLCAKLRASTDTRKRGSRHANERRPITFEKSKLEISLRARRKRALSMA